MLLLTSSFLPFVLDTDAAVDADPGGAEVDVVVLLLLLVVR